LNEIAQERYRSTFRPVITNYIFCISNDIMDKRRRAFLNSWRQN